MSRTSEDDPQSLNRSAAGSAHVGVFYSLHNIEATVSKKPKLAQSMLE